MTDQIRLNPDTASRLNEGVQVGQSIELPFFAPVFWVLNGDSRLRAAGDAQYYGGWAISAEEWRAALEEWQIQETEVPGLSRTELTTADGKSLDAYTTRSLLIAPICTRTTWVSENGIRASEYQPGTRQRTQAICFMATKQESGIYRPLGVIMLSAKGFQAKNLLDAFSQWNRATAKARGRIAPGVPAWCFYLSIGTFGERKQVMVGKGSQSPITPIGAYIPNDISDDLMRKLFVGNNVAEAMAIHLEAAQEWLHAYDAKPVNSNRNGNGGAVGYIPPEPDFPDDLLPPEEEIPF